MATTEQEKKQNPETPSNQGVGTSQTSETYNAGYKPIDNSGRNYAQENGMSAEDQAKLSALGTAWNEASAAGNHEEAARIHEEAEALRRNHGYEGGIDGSQNIKTANAASPEIAPVNSAAPDFSPELNAWLAASQAQQQAQIDYATNQGVKELKRAEEDAQEQFQTQQNQTDRDEAKALDNQALYAEARGDRGGIGEAQYAQIQATAMQNRRAINSARTKLATDTSRAIADLRAQGEFQKADALLQLTQTYLGQLIELQQWGAEYTLSVDQFNIGLQQWQAEFGEQARQFDLEFNENQRRWGLEFGLEQDQLQYAKNQDAQNKLAQSGLAALAVGIRPSKAQQAALGYTDAQIEAELSAYKLAQAAGVKLTGGGDGQTGVAPDPSVDPYGYLAYHGFGDRATVLAQLKKVGYDKDYVEGMADQYFNNYLPSLGLIAEPKEFEWTEDKLAYLDMASYRALGLPASLDPLAALKNANTLGMFEYEPTESGKIKVRWAKGKSIKDFWATDEYENR